jgi:hypothetical protein
MHLCVEYLDPVNMDRARVTNSVLGGLVFTAHMDLGLLQLHTVVAKV